MEIFGSPGDIYRKVGHWDRSKLKLNPGIRAESIRVMKIREARKDDTRFRLWTTNPSGNLGFPRSTQVCPSSSDRCPANIKDSSLTVELLACVPDALTCLLITSPLKLRPISLFIARRGNLLIEFELSRHRKLPRISRFHGGVLNLYPGSLKLKV